MDFIEEKTQKGYTLKINLKKNNFLVFNRKGASVFMDSAQTKIIHKIPFVIFLGGSFKIYSRININYALYKISQGKIVLPYSVRGNPNLRYILLDTEEHIDMVPVRIGVVASLQDLVKYLESGFNPDAIIVDEDITTNDIIVIKNREKKANIIVAEGGTRAGVVQQHKVVFDEKEDSGDDYVMNDEFNLNIMSQNPVFLARLHLRQHDVMRVKQLLLDFDLPVIDADYILTFINAMMKQEMDKDSRDYKNLSELYNNFEFYKAVISRNDEEVAKKISKITTSNEISFFHTIIAKGKSIMTYKDDQMLMTEYENMLYEKNEELKNMGKAGLDIEATIEIDRNEPGDSEEPEKLAMEKGLEKFLEINTDESDEITGEIDKEELVPDKKDDEV